ncbi:OLC1v1017485C1 [Oldenlandia corymbosa var. corymbosa]|uniref:OLC1v1017485C1 n=1 Tax=Oldenlandia corymbosa var. corymbosa TaxID=529605 RepID=A0AAV1E9L8_OLDCO|nr:OLC1v1017485C1 [Oldenlandia corymbosa var. corymbosa]
MSFVSSRAAAIRTNKKCEVYIATVPLKAPRGPPQVLMSTLYSLNLFQFQHYMVIINNNNNNASQSEVLVCDFQPEDPEDIFTAVSALSGGKVPGVVLTRKLKKLPTRKCWFVGHCSDDDYGVEEGLREFNEDWDTDLRIGHHDCRNYVNELVEFLTGEKQVLARGIS